MKKITLLIAFSLASMAMAQPAQDLYNDALKMLDDGDVQYKIESKISAAIDLDSLNLDYRWVRARNNLKSISGEKEFKSAIKDLEFMIANGGGTSNVYGNLGLAYQELEKFLKYNKPKESKSFRDEDNSEEMKAYYKILLENATKSLKAYQNAIEVKPEAKQNLNSRVSTMKDKVQEYEKNILDL